MKGSYWRVCLSVLAVSFLALTTTPARSDIVDGLLNYWPLDDTLEDAAGDYPGSAGTVSDDGEFDGTNGTGGIDFNDGLFDQAIEQDGAGGAAQDNGFVRIVRSEDTLRAGESISISAWIETAGFDTSWQTILSHGEGSQYRVARRSGSNVASYAGGVGDIPASDIGPDIGPDTGWHHIVAISENGVSTRIWVDGELIETGGAPTITDNGNGGAPGGSTPDLYIGANPQTGAQNREWWGKIDDVATWDRPLEEDEILEIYEAGVDGTSLGELMQPAPVGAGEVLGVATESLLGGDLTDVGNDGDEALYNPPDELGNFDAVFFSSDEPGFGGGESAFNVFDNTLGPGNDKWCCGTVFPQIVGADFSASNQTYRLTHFTVSSANDAPERDPRVWSIQGSNDGFCWTTIFSHSDPDASLWTERLQVILFREGVDYRDQTTGYAMFRMATEATGATAGAFFQIGEIEFFGEAAPPPAVPVTSCDPGRILGTGTDALLGHDLTDYYDNGIEADYNPPDDLGGFTATFFSSDEPGFGGGEFAFNVFDNTLGPGNDKWCCGTVFPQIVGADFGDEAFMLTHFTVSSANDVPDRDPRVWRIEGSVDGTNWTTIFSHDNPNRAIWTERLQVIRFEAGRDYPEQTEAYSKFRMVTEATGATAGAFFQIGEIEFFDANFVPPPETFAGIVDGLLNYWPFDGTLEDVAGDFPGSAGVVDDDGEFDGTNGTAGIDFNDGLFGDAIEQDGGLAQDNGFVRVARSEDTLQAGESISISVWVEATGFDTSWQTILSHGEGNQYRVARRGDGSVAAYAGGVGDIPASEIGPDIGADTGWHHIVSISERDVSTRIWVDGELIETGGVPNITDSGNGGAPGGSTPDLFIGANPQTGAQNREWWGKIDDVATWDRPLGEDEILEIYEAGLDGAPLGELMAVDTGPRFVRGDATSDGLVNLSDPVFTLNGLFSGGPPSLCVKTEDTNDDGAVNLADPVYLLNSLFSGGPEPPPPATDCGEDPTPDDISCESYPPCDG